jgi:ubiquinone/menaquinone biosynthesis C-methylase UbiE
MASARPKGLEGIIAFQAGNAEALPFGDRTFNVALSVTMMEILNAYEILRGLIRVIRPGGRVAVVAWCEIPGGSPQLPRLSLPHFPHFAS